jgi:quinoprotein glucose dehydrogenase
MRSFLLFALMSLATASRAATFPGLELRTGFHASVFATSNHVGNAVAICFDPAGRLHTVEANRRITGTWGVTMSRWWAMEDYAGNTLEDRAAMYARWAHIVPPAKLTRDADVLRRLFDRDGDGRADDAEILARFNGPLEGNAAGVLALGDTLFVANAPSLWSMPSDRPDKGRPLHTGLGVRVGVYGHDLHGLIPGPDGRIYFSIGDRGFHLRTAEGKPLSAPRRGAVFRCLPDGAGLELFHIGLRNPQDLAFNELGDLFTVDNDMGGVDRSRVVHVIEGGDSGWDATYQLTRNFREETRRANHPEPPWFTEGLWETRHPGQPAWLHPPIAHLTSGPSGMEFDPGWGLPEGLRNAMFVCDFKGSSARSGIHSFHLQPNGAGWRITETNRFAWGILPADIEFGHDGCLYVADWIGGWGGNGERRIVRLEHDQTRTSERAVEVRTLMASDWQALTRGKLISLLGHFDRRVRLNAQYELARRNDTNPFREAAANKSLELTPRRHGIHGLWQIGLRRQLPPEDLATLTALMRDPIAEIRAQSAKVLGEIGTAAESTPIKALLTDNDERVRYFATLSLGRLGTEEAVPAILDLLRRERDPVVRHGAVMTLSHLASATRLAKLGTDAAPRIRLAGVLALRRQSSSELLNFLNDPDPEVRFATIRAVHDLEIRGAMEALSRMATAALLKEKSVPFPIRHRLLNALFRHGSREDAARLAVIAATDTMPAPIRLEALDCLAHWTNPSPFDRVTWHHRPVPQARATNIGPTIAPAILELIGKVRADSKQAEWLKPATELVARHQLGTRPQRLALLTDPTLDAAARIPIFEEIQRTPDRDFELACDELLKLEKDSALRTLAAGHRLPTPHAVAALDDLWRTGNEAEKRFLLGRTNLTDSRWGAGLLAGETRRELAGQSSAWSLDVFLAASRSSDAAVRQSASEWRARLRSTTNTLAEYSLALSGGDPSRGGQLFATHAVQCVRCHRVKGFGGDAGPDLTRIARELNRTEIVTALIEPSKRIAPGFATFEFGLTDGDEVSGFVETETKDLVTVLQMDGQRRNIPTGSIDTRSKPVSAMPSMRDILSLSETRDLAAYLSTLK